MKKFLLFLLCGCSGFTAPDDFTYKEIPTNSYTLASWQKITDKTSLIRIYIEGDGYAFNAQGQPTSDPTPHGTFLREIAFNDPNPNVVYLARPCQYIHDDNCTQTDWTTGRFSKKIVDSTTQAINNISNKRDIILIGYSGGALLSGLIIDQHPKMPVKKWITLAGVLNHTKWTSTLKLPPLQDSIDLNKLPNVPQIHIIGTKDKIIPLELTQSIVPQQDLIIIPNATHTRGFESKHSIIYKNR